MGFAKPPFRQGTVVVGATLLILTALAHGTGQQIGAATLHLRGQFVELSDRFPRQPHAQHYILLPRPPSGLLECRSHNYNLLQAQSPFIAQPTIAPMSIK